MTPQAPLLLEAVVFLAKAPASPVFPVLEPGFTRESEPPPEVNVPPVGLPQANLAPPLGIATTPAAGPVAFILRLTPNRSEIMNAPSAVVPTPLLAAVKSASGLSTKPVPTVLTSLNEPMVNSTHEFIAPAASAATPLDEEHASISRLVASPVLTPKNTEPASAWLPPSAPQPGALDKVGVEPQASGVTLASQNKSQPQMASGPQLKSAPPSPNPQPKSDPAISPRVSAVVAAGPPHNLSLHLDEMETHNAPLAVAPSLPPPKPAGESGTSSSEAKPSKPEIVTKQRSPESRLGNCPVDDRAKITTVSTFPSGGAPTGDDHGLSSDFGVGSTSGKSTAPKVTSEPELKTIALPLSRQISLNLSTDDSNRVNIGLTERAGKVLVAVRTSDHELAQSLQTDLGDLVGRLESKGFKTESWIPAAAHQAMPLQASNTTTGFGQSQHAGAGNGGSQQRQKQNGSPQRQKARWAAQLEKTVSSNQARSEN